MIHAEDVPARPDVTLLAHNDEKGVRMGENGRFRRLYMFDHLEYDSESLADEYFRDLEATVAIKPPFDCFPSGDPEQRPRNRWRSHGHGLGELLGNRFLFSDLTRPPPLADIALAFDATGFSQRK